MKVRYFGGCEESVYFMLWGKRDILGGVRKGCMFGVGGK